MTEPNPPRRSLATYLRPAPAAAAQQSAAGTEPVREGVDGVDGVDAPIHHHAIADARPAPPPAEGAPGDDRHALYRQPLQADDEAKAYADAVTADAVTPPQQHQPAAAAAAVAPAAEPDAAVAVSDAPSFLDRARRRRPTPRWQWALAVVLALLLVVQIILADRARWAADAGSRPWVTALCDVLRCSVPAWHEPAAFTMTSREIRPLPGQPGVLQVQASIRNDARWAQPWPQLRLSLADADGRVIGAGVFTPAQYLGHAAATGTTVADTTVAATLEPGQSARIAFRVREPAASTDAFTFEFL